MSTFNGIIVLVSDEEVAVTSVGIGIPGLVDSKNGVIVKTPNLPFENTPIRELFQKEWDIPVYLGNDAGLIGAAMLCSSI